MEASWFTCSQLNHFRSVLWNFFFNWGDSICQVNWLRMNCKQLPGPLPEYATTFDPPTPTEEQKRMVSVPDGYTAPGYYDEDEPLW